MEIKWPVTDWEKIFAEQISDKRFYPEYIKNTLELNNKKTSQFFNGQKFEQLLHKRQDVMANKHMNH